ncbi:MAG: metal ABC transporter substrate-binding protein [Ruminococcus sp.]
MLNRKIASILLCLSLTASFTVGCADSSAPAKDSDSLRIVCTLFPQYDWARQIIGYTENVELTLLADNGADLHSYQPGTDDMVNISTCDILIYVGGESDSWIEDALTHAANPDMIRINLTSIMGGSLKEEEHIEGMEEHDHHEETAEYDEHVWLSLKNAIIFCHAISDALCTADEEHADGYRENAECYLSLLQNADADFQTTVQQAKRKTLLFGDRFPFRYLMDDYGLTYYAAFPGCSAESEASFETIVFLANQVDERKLPAVCTIDGSDSSIAEAIISNTSEKNQKILQLNSMQSVSRTDIDNGVTYLSIMEENLAKISEALN